jgi:hypothetical protein
MVWGEVFSRFLKESPVAVMVCALMEHVLAPEKIDRIFARNARFQYQRDVLFSTMVDLMSEVVCGVRPSVNAAYRRKKKREQIAVSVGSLYDKLKGVEERVNRALVRETAAEMAEVVRHLGGACTPLLEGYRVKILDGNALAKTERRVKETRTSTAGPLPGKALVVLEPELGLLTDVFCSEDGHAQERSLLPQVLETVERDDVWIADRNFSTAGFLFSLEARGAAFVIRRHAKLACQEVSEAVICGSVEGGEVYEQAVVVRGEAGKEMRLRQVVVRLEKPTRDGAKELRILTNLPVEAADARKVAELYRKRWKIEGAFHQLSQTLQSEINTLGYPPAALLGFCVGLVSFNLFAVVKAALRSAYGDDVVEEEISTYYLTDEIAGTYRGMRIAIPEGEWAVFHEIDSEEMAKFLWEWAGMIDLSLYRKSKRGPKKTPPLREHDPKQPHVSTARLLAQRRGKP